MKRHWPWLKMPEAMQALSGSETMVRQKLQRCISCGAHGLSTTCHSCGENAQAAGPMKWSPEDPQAARRRQRQDVGSKQWLESLPKAIIGTVSEEE